MTAVAIFGVSGRTGGALTAAARARGWTIRSYARISSVAPSGVAVISGTFGDVAQIVPVVECVDAVCCVYGPRAPYVDVFCAAATRAVIAAMQRTPCHRLLCVTGAMIGDVPTRSRPMAWARSWFRWRRPAVAQDRDEQEAIVMASDLDWTIVMPPRLTEAGPSGRVLAGPDLPVGLRSAVSRADLAAFMLDEIATPRFVRERIIVQQGH
ncbi:MAG: NAD(P)H-binding protein [Gemmatimonadota bacterium]|nr:NAD(P)H-binding protein [Gemmatimonadota bacterium]